MKRFLPFLGLLAIALFHCAGLLSATEGVTLALAPAISFTSLTELFRPSRVAQVIMASENYGTPVMDLFYPESRRSAWPDVMVPLSKITSVTRAVPVVLRGSPGITLPGSSGANRFILPQPIKTRDAVGATELNNASIGGMTNLQMWADERTARHLATHRLTTEALAAQSLTGTISFPIADETGVTIDTYTVAFGTVGSFTVTADWTNSGTALSTIYKNLVAMDRQLTRAGYSGRKEVLIGENIAAALTDKIQAVANDMRTSARVQDDGTIRINQFVLRPFVGEYYHPGGVGGSPAAGYTQVVGDDEVVMYDTTAPFTFLRVKLDNFKLPPNPAPLGVIPVLNEDGSAINLYAESKPFPIPVAEAMIRTDATAT